MERTQGWRAVRSDLFAPSYPTPVRSSLSSWAPNTAEGGNALQASLRGTLLLPDPLGDYAYTGSVIVDGTLYALIEHQTSKEGWYVKAGDFWQSYSIVEVTEQAVVLVVERSRRLLPKSKVINLVPLSADANHDGSSGNTTGPTPAAQTASKKNTESNDGFPLSVDEIADMKSKVAAGHMSAAEGAGILVENTDKLRDIAQESSPSQPPLPKPPVAVTGGNPAP